MTQMASLLATVFIWLMDFISTFYSQRGRGAYTRDYAGT